MITIHDVAKEAGVSVGTVSNVLNNSPKVRSETKTRVLQTIKKLNYVPNNVAQALKTSHLKDIGIIAEDISCFSSPHIVDGICEYFEQRGYRIKLANLRVKQKVKNTGHALYELLLTDTAFKEELEGNINSLLTSQIGGLIYIGVHPRDITGLLPALDIPLVYTYSYTSSKNDYCVNYNDNQGAFLAVSSLAEKGHKRIALISGSVNSIPAHKRLLAYQTVLMEHHLTYQSEYIKTGNWSYQDGYQLCTELLELEHPPTAIFAMSDVMAYGAMNAVKDKRLQIPADIAIHGFDNLEHSSYTYPPLTSIELPLKEMGEVSAAQLLKLIKKETPEEHSVLLDCKHVPGQTI